MGYKVLIARDAQEFVNSLPIKSQNIVKENLKKLRNNPYPGKGSGDKEKLIYQGKSLYRLHIVRSFTAFYMIYDDEGVVKILRVMTIDAAHKRYGRL